MIYSRRALTHFLRRRHLVLLIAGSIMTSGLIALWYLPYPDSPMFVYRALRADPIGYITLRTQRWLAYTEKTLGLGSAPELNIQIKSNHMETLRKKRETALRIGFLIQEEEDFVPGTIRLEDKTVKVRLRLKGDKIDHLRGYGQKTTSMYSVCGGSPFKIPVQGTINLNVYFLKPSGYSM